MQHEQLIVEPYGDGDGALQRGKSAGSAIRIGSHQSPRFRQRDDPAITVNRQRLYGLAKLRDKAGA